MDGATRRGGDDARLRAAAARAAGRAGGVPWCGYNWFGAAAARTDGRPGYRRADVVARGYHGEGRHAFLDVAVTDSGVGRALDATPSSATSSGVAAEMRAAQKVGKYGALAAQVSSSFHPAVIERYGRVP